MGQRALKYGAVLIGTYLAVYYWTGFGKDVQAVTNLVVAGTRTFQGR